MVRLRPRVQEFYKQFARFQFQYGAIKTARKVPTRLGITRFQFQYGAIKTKTLRRNIKGITVSIPIWCD